MILALLLAMSQASAQREAERLWPGAWRLEQSWQRERKCDTAVPANCVLTRKVVKTYTVCRVDTVATCWDGRSYDEAFRSAKGEK